MSRQNLGWLIGIGAVSIFGFAVSLAASNRDYSAEVGRDIGRDDYEYVRLFVDVIHEVRARHVKKLSKDQMRRLVEDMLDGGLERLDDHSGFIGSKEYDQFNRRTKGKFGGIGAQIGHESDSHSQLIVVSPMPRTPAAKAGLRAGDAILKIDGKSTDKFTTNKAAELIQGEENTEVTLTVRSKGGQPRELKIVRAVIKISNVYGDVLVKGEDWDFLIDKQNKIGYIRLLEFTATTAEDMRAALKELKEEGVRAIVLDLRNNPGGLLESAKDICNFFLSDGRIVSTRGRDDDVEVRDADPDKAIFGPDSGVLVAVLINRYSASASEIVSAALQDRDRAVVFGERSYGKGSVQNIIPMEKSRTALKLTTATYRPPSGRNIHRFPDSKDDDEWGVKPTVLKEKGKPDLSLEVPVTPTELSAWVKWRSERDLNDEKQKLPYADQKDHRDKVLDRALEYLREQLKSRKAGQAAPRPRMSVAA